VDCPVIFPSACEWGYYETIHRLKDTSAIELDEAIDRILQLPSVASKNFLITIGDRSVTGMVARDQLVGPWQVPVADCAISTSDYTGYKGEIMSLGERAPLALCDASAAARMTIGEALTNMLGGYVQDISHISLSANWMVMRKFLLATLGSCNILSIASSSSIALVSKALRLIACVVALIVVVGGLPSNISIGM
jgi:hypothetical protein